MPLLIRTRVILGPPVQQRILRMGGTDGLITNRSKFRVAFSGITLLGATCTAACATFIGNTHFKITGSIAGTYDSDPLTVSCANTKNGAGPTVTAYPNAACTGGSVGSALASLVVNLAGTLPGHTNKLQIALASASGVMPGYFFEAAIDPCDFIDGAVFNNRITTGGCYAAMAAVPANPNAFGTGGTATITHLCP